MKKFGILSIVLLIAIVSGLTGCTTGADQTEKTEKILNLNLTGEPTSLDPAKAFDEDSLDVTHNLFVGLMRLDKNHQPQKAIAKEVKTSSDGLTYTFTLNKTKWSNGENLTAHDFEFAWKRVLDPKTASEAAFLLYFIKGAEEYNTGKGSADQVGVKALDDYTLEVKLTRPTPSFLQLTAYSVYSPVYKKGAEQNPALYNEAKSYVSNGAFKMTEWKHDGHIKVARNENYYNKEVVKLSGIHFSIVTDSNTAYQMYKTKKLDVIAKKSIPGDLLAQMIKSGEVKTWESNGLAFFRFNVKKEPFTNVKIRKAFALAVDRKLIVEQIVQSGEQPAYAYVAPSAPNNFRQKGGNLIQDGQFAEAKKLLEEGMKEEGWSKLPTVTLLYSNTTEKNKKIAEAVQEMYRKHLGVEIQLQAKENKVYFADQRSKNYIMTTSSFLADYNDTYNYLESFQTDHSMNRTNWSNKKYDEYLQKAAQSSNQEERDKFLHEAEKILFEEMPLFPLYFYNTAAAEQPGVTGIIRHPVGQNDYTQADKK
ncbi:peptide ABC transporter substrate-binding protein [Paenactinomyces guangxiensis]|uniref:Peptide ABC transporter substrate-binding protein n=1 Tax=Paenactinomyces guangxiensis TaxID=1490290 RepID=A0A7W1WNL4_9BACL|nr:peptide ABC transporter substrate-binding protein [Paenactinomyces guangxiensis]MBA4493212.1 peptide ABC transporter substrate-binding protein [Paenactinomyces guangxiensis]MBH8589938.1 peptide ABC transporter substrate-binding protein [Paenactinomyces guangxiensis]